MRATFLVIGLGLISLAAPGLSLATEEAGEDDQEEKGADQEKEDFQDFGEISIDDLLTKEVAGASRGQARSLRDAPGAITVFTREDIEQSGARDLLDILMNVPGFQFGTDNYSAVYPGVRGLWAADGKTLILLDGHILSERLYDTTMLGNRIPVDWIERVEILRGPGSAMYGGTAELAVINIVTRQARDLQGFHVSGVYGQMMHGIVADGMGPEDTFGRRNLSLQWGQRFPESDLDARLGVFAGQGNRSDRVYTDSLGQSYNMAGQADADPLLATLALDWKGLELRYLFERYHTSQRDFYGESIDLALPVDMTTSALRLAYHGRPLEELRVQPRLEYVWQKPWQTTDERAHAYEGGYYDPTAHEVRLGLHVDWTPIASGEYVERLSLLAGGEYTYLWGEETTEGFIDPDDPENILDSRDFHHVALYLEAILDTSWLNATAGAMYEYRDRIGSSVVPCAVLQKAYGPFHFKAMVSQAYRAPSPMVAAYAPDARAEKTTVYELELGVQPIQGLALLVNGFDITIEDPIVYYYDEETDDEGYRNYSQTGTRGLEAEIRYKRGIWGARLTYSFYDVVGKNEVDTFRVPGARHVMLGMAPHKATLSGSVRVLEDLSLYLSLQFLSDQRWAYEQYDADDVQVLRELPELWLLDAYLRYDNLFARGLWLGFGVYNILDQRIEYAQPYNNYHPPLQGQSLEILLRLGYDLPLE